MVDALETVALEHWTIGTGRPLLIVHGGPGLDHSYLRPWLDPLAKQRQLIFVDLRASGQSPSCLAEDFKLDNIVADLEALRTRLGIERWSLLGHSAGGFVVQHYARNNPDRIDSIVLASTSAAPAKIRPAVFELAKW